MMNMGKPIVVGMSIPEDFKVDVRVLTTVEQWDRTDKAETYYAQNIEAIADYAKYRIPHPTHVLFMDSRILPRVNTLDRLLRLDKDVVTGIFPIQTKTDIAWNVVRDKFYIKRDELPDNPFKITSGDAGIVLMKYKVVEKIDPSNLLESARQAGFDIWCDPKVKCNNIRLTNLLSIVNIMKGNTQ
jgi:hypothetical protein